MQQKNSFLKTPFFIGSVELPSNILYAPLAGCSDYPFRMMTAKYSPGLMFCEMVKMDPLVRRIPTTMRMLDYCESMRPIGGQICGSKPEIAGEAAKIIEDLGFDTVDLNCGCPVDKVTKDGSGSGMLRTPELIGEIISEMVARVSIPVTVKIRVGWDESHINAVEITRIAEAAGAKAICIHGRTRQQGYKGPANWNHIRDCKQVAKQIKVIGNGDLFDPLAVERMFAETGCDAVLIARGTMGQPWIVQDVIRHFHGLSPIQRNPEQMREALLEHFMFMQEYFGANEHRIVVDMRRVGCWYLSNFAGASAVRQKMCKAAICQEIHDLILNFPLHERAQEQSDSAEVQDFT